MNSLYSKGEVLATLPDCFLKFENFSFAKVHKYNIFSFNDTAGRDGQLLYGGLMDKCHTVDYYKFKWDLLYSTIFKYNILPPIGRNTTKIAYHLEHTHFVFVRAMPILTAQKS